MDLSLRPETLAALAAFRARRHTLLWRQGLVVALFWAVSSLLVVALLDRAWLMPDAIRPWCSLAAYAACAVVSWRVAWRFFMPVDDHAGAARMAEGVAPELREKLLSAVELSQAPEHEVKDSPEFRAKLQAEVADVARQIDWTARQPATVLVPWIKRFVLLAAVVVGLATVPKLHLPGFLARAALPFANLERPSSVQITVQKPGEVNSIAPIASEVDIAVQITGESVARALIEYGSPDASTSRMELSKISPQNFEARLPVGQNDVRFRILASDGISAWHTLAAKARPRITQFTKVIAPPPYVKGQEVSVTDDSGDIEALSGSTVKLQMQCNQPITSAKLVINPDLPTHPAAPEIQIKENGLLEATLPITDEAEAWTVQLKSAETGFTNDDAASWRITVVPDLPPVVQVLDPKEAQLSLLADESVRLAGEASDDVGLASVKLAHAVNGTTWTDIDLGARAGTEASVQHLLPLAPLQLNAGDTVLMKLVATDLKGQKAESAPLRVIILEQTVDPAKRAFAAEQRRLAGMAKTLMEKTRDLTKDASQIQKVAKSKDQNKQVKAGDDAESKLARFQQSLETTRQQADDLWEQLKKTAQQAPTRMDAEETRLLGDRIARLRQDSLRQMEQNTRDEVTNPEAVKRAAAEAHGEAAIVDDAVRAFATEDTARITAQATQQMARQQNLLTDTSLNGNRDQSQRGKWQEQQRAALIANEVLKEEFDSLKEQVHGGHQNNLERMKKEIGEAANDLRESLDRPEDPKIKDQPQPKSPEHLYGASDNLRQRLQRSADAIRGMADESANRSRQMREALANRENPAMQALEQAQAALNEAAQVAKDPKRAAKQKADKQGQMPAERAQSQLAAASRQMQDQAELREQNAQTRSQAALDTNRASRAAEQLSQMTAEAEAKGDAAALEQARDKASELAKVTRTLDADALVQEAQAALADAAMQSGTDVDKAQATADAAQQAADQLRQLPQAARRLNANEAANTAQQAADQARNAAQQLNDQARQASQRQGSQPVPQQQTPPSLGEAQAKAAQVAQALAAQTEAAREQLLAMTPKVSDMMKQVAKELNETKDKTMEAKQEADAQKPVAEVAEKAQDLQPEAAENTEKMQALQAALRQEANAAELAQADQRQLARTADVALEAMRQKSPQIQSNLKQAAQAQQSQPQSAALQKAADAQQQTADALQQLAQNFAKMERGEEVPQENLEQLAQMEQQLGVQEPLEEAYDKAKELADVAQDAKNDPQKALAELEKQLSKSPAMQKALANIAKDTAQTAEKTLGEKANQPAMLGTVAEDAGHQLQRVARHQKRLGKEEAAKQVTEASTKLQATAKATKTEPGNATAQVAQEATQASQAAAKAAEQAASQTEAPPNLSAFDQTQAQSLAQALDQLDAQLNPMNGGQPQQAQQGQQQGQQPGQQQQGAQQSLSQAQQSQQQSMAQSRAQGKVPGQSQSNQQTAQNQPKSNQQADSGQQSKDGGNYTQVMKNGQMVLVPVGEFSVADWGKLPSRMAEDLTEATRQEAAPEYRAAIENYYKAIADKAKR